MRLTTSHESHLYQSKPRAMRPIFFRTPLLVPYRMRQQKKDLTSTQLSTRLVIKTVIVQATCRCLAKQCHTVTNMSSHCARHWNLCWRPKNTFMKIQHKKTRNESHRYTPRHIVQDTRGPRSIQTTQKAVVDKTRAKKTNDEVIAEIVMSCSHVQLYFHGIWP